MKRLVFLLILLLLIPSISQARPRGIFKTVASGSVTKANMRLSGVDGLAFVDFGAANVLTTKVGHLLKITDSAGKSIMGYIKAAGSSEGLGDELITGWTIHPSYLVETYAVTGTNITQFVNSAGGYGIVYVDKGVDLRLALYKYSTDATINSGKFDAYGIGFGGSSSSQRVTYTKPASTGTYSGYITPNYTSSLGFITIMAGPTSALDAAFINNTLKQVLTPSATGVTIVSSKGGATYNWFNKNSAFNWNDTSGYTYQIIKENRTTLIATSNVTAYNALMDTTTANAFAAPVGVDLTAYQDGRHLAHFTDSSGRVAVGWISATAPSGETLGDELITDWTNSGYETLTLSGTDITQAVNSDASRAMAYKQTGLEAYALAKLVIGAFTFTSGQRPYFTFSSESPSLANSTNGRQISYADMAAQTAYGTMSTAASYSGFMNPLGANGNWAATGISFKRVLDCAATGALLLSSKGGSRGYVYKNALFNPNAALTMKILFIGD